jgi:hypothetical protein
VPIKKKKGKRKKKNRNARSACGEVGAGVLVFYLYREELKETFHGVGQREGGKLSGLTDKGSARSAWALSSTTNTNRYHRILGRDLIRWRANAAAGFASGGHRSAQTGPRPVHSFEDCRSRRSMGRLPCRGSVCSKALNSLGAWCYVLSGQPIPCMAQPLPSQNQQGTSSRLLVNIGSLTLHRWQ